MLDTGRNCESSYSTTFSFGALPRLLLATCDAVGGEEGGRVLAGGEDEELSLLQRGV